MKRHAHGAKRGFTLTEIAIVLGIIGLILGAIWVAAAAVYNNLRVSKATTQLLQITQNVRALYATSARVDPLANINTPGQQAGQALTYIQANVFPNDTLSSSGGAGQPVDTVQSPWNGGIYITAQQSQGGVANDSFQVAFDAVPQSACIGLITANSGEGRDPGMVSVDVAAGTTGAPVAPAFAAQFPIPASTAQQACAGATNTVAFTFRLK